MGPRSSQTKQRLMHGRSDFCTSYACCCAYCGIKRSVPYLPSSRINLLPPLCCAPQVDSTLLLCDALSGLHASVTQQTASLSSSCERLVTEREQLAEFAAAVQAKLKFFDEFESVFAQFQSAQVRQQGHRHVQQADGPLECGGNFRIP